VLPGAIGTPMLRSALGELETAESQYAPQLSLLNRFGTPREVAQAHLFLCSDLASYVTGHPLAVKRA
jgi:glucose 1-dehydrogenase